MISLKPNHEDKYVDLYTVNSRCVCLSIIVTSLSLDAGTLEPRTLVSDEGGRIMIHQM